MRVQKEVVKIFTTATGAELVEKALKEKEKALKEKMEEHTSVHIKLEQQKQLTEVDRQISDMRGIRFLDPLDKEFNYIQDSVMVFVFLYTKYTYVVGRYF